MNSVKPLLASLSLLIAPLAFAGNHYQYDDTWFGPAATGGTLPESDWGLHQDHGWLYFSSAGAEATWFYDIQIDALGDGFTGWAYSDSTVFPYIYLDGADLWVIYVAGAQGNNGLPRVFVETAGFSTVLLNQTGREIIVTDNIIDIAVAADDFNSLAAALTRAELVEALQAEGPFTVFAPTDEAFAALDSDLLDALLTDDALLDTLTDILLYHVVSGEVSAADLGFDPESVFSARSSTFYVSALNGVDIKFDVTPFGVILNDTAMVTLANIEASNGMIHVIDNVIVPPGTIVDVAIEADEFENLVAAVVQAELADVLSDDGPFTVFAPVDAAFAALGEETLATLFEDENRATLAAILTYHVIPGKIYASEVAAGTTATTVNGADVSFEIDEDGDLTIDGAKIIITNIRARNGVIHVIDSVILPPQ